MTAWNSFYGLVKLVSGEAIWVNAASSSVGEVVVQLAKTEGIRVIASVSLDEKLAYVVDQLSVDGVQLPKTTGRCGAEAAGAGRVRRGV
jgi:NADPH-dependent curcumin reductase CurA